jgi:hypothetical protein
MKDIFELINEFMKTHSHIKPLEFHMLINSKTKDPFFRVSTKHMVYIWYYDIENQEDYKNGKKYWLPVYQEYEIWSVNAIRNAVYEMMLLGQTCPEMANHLGYTVPRVSKIYRELVADILQEKGSEYWQDIKEGWIR